MRSKRVRSHRKKSKRGIYVLPNLLTSASLFGGFYAIIASIHERWEPAAIAILISAVLDALDGKIARVTRSTSLFGKEYDSLSDLVAFGVAPGVLAYQWTLHGFGRFGWLACFMYVICGALRLARFNVQHDSMESGYFKGLPIPAAASFIAATVLFSGVLGPTGQARHIFLIVALYLLSFLMVSTTRYLSVKELDLRKRKPFNFLVYTILVCLVVAYKPTIMLFVFWAAYPASGPVMSWRHYRQRHRSPAESVEKPVSADPH